ncbi:YcjX family protein [Puniceicoccus vermicola]|uniref:YcjX family protein n=1 Tax=Puniceicoccus vermicola TaxID=388746 RepID=A0A7X1B298_9BACT|nr:YcjX family protein [Puniceicoccus vermicola]MBC2604202.1 YcjX family protein [Puniceicoccus vermicola]
MRSPFPKVSRYRRIVTVGPRHSGKSVLLSSILDHLRKNPDRFLGTNEGWTSHSVHPYPADLPEIPLDRILREASEEALWPEITVKPAALRFRAAHPKPWKRDLTLDFIDFPGENIADFLGAGDYESWSNAIFNLYPDHLDPDSVKGITNLREMIGKNSPAQEIADHYAQMMIEATRRGRYLTSPATLCTRVFEPDHRVANEDFAPVPTSLQTTTSETGSYFGEKFRQYHEQRIRPLERLLAEADALVIPIDVGWILSGGPPLLRDQHALLSAIGSLLARIDTIWSRMASFLGRSFTPLDDAFFPGRLRSVVLCATKIDLFRPEDRSLLEDLVRRIAEPIFRGAGLHGIKVLFTACSAIRSTTDHESKPGYLRGFRSGQPVEIAPPKLPDEWPDRWDPKDYQFPRLDPRVSRHGLYPPAHIHLDRLVRSILES